MLSDSNKKKPVEENERNEYDLLIRNSLLPLSQFILRQKGIIGMDDTIRLTTLPQKITRVDAREIDSFFIYVDKEDSENPSSLIHIEYQTDDDPLMLGRMREYHSRILNEIESNKELASLRGLEIHSVVVYAGKNKSKMKYESPSHQVFKGFDLVELKDIPYREFLKTEDATLISAAILGDFGNEDSSTVAREITDTIANKTKDNSSLKETSLRNLHIFSNLRNLGKLIGKLLEKMIKFDETKDIFYIKGIEKGIEKGIGKGMMDKTYSSAFKMMDKGFEAEVIKNILDIDDKLYAEIEKAYKTNQQQKK